MKVMFLAQTLAGLFLYSVHAQVPQLINYQGRLTAEGTNFAGPGQFKFALVDGNTNIFWSNSGLSGTPLEPTAAVSLNVSNGLFSLLLGDTNLANMAAIPVNVFTNPDVRVRIWFDDGISGFQRLLADQRIGAVAYALMAANVPDASITAAKLANGAVTGTKIASGAVGSSQLAAGAVTSTRIATGAVGANELGAGAVTSSRIAAGAVGANQLAAGAVTSSRIADGAVGSAQLAPNAVQSNNIAPGAIGVAQLSKPPRSGSVNSSSLLISFDEAVFTVPFSPAFATTPNVTLTLQTISDPIANGSILTAQSNSTTSFTAKWWLPKRPITVVDQDFGGWCFMAPLANGIPAICYENELQRPTYIRADALAGGTWRPPVIVDNVAGRSPSMAVVNGNPAMAYNNVTAGDLKYVRAADANGLAWGTPVNVDTTGTVGANNSLAVLSNGFPAISYYAASPANDLKFARATDINGAAWAVANLDTAGDVGQHTSLARVNNHPAISYYDNNNDRLKYIRATNPDGTSWGAAIIVDNDVSSGPTSLTVVNGNPAICYYSSLPSGLNYLRANDVNGNTWGAPIQIDPDAINIGSISLRVLNGFPCVSYTSNSELRFLRAGDASGTTWSRPAKLETEGTTVFHTSIGFFNARLAVAYHDQTHDMLKFVTPSFSTVPAFTITWMALEP